MNFPPSQPAVTLVAKVTYGSNLARGYCFYTKALARKRLHYILRPVDLTPREIENMLGLRTHLSS